MDTSLVDADWNFNAEVLVCLFEKDYKRTRVVIKGDIFKDLEADYSGRVSNCSYAITATVAAKKNIKKSVTVDGGVVEQVERFILDCSAKKVA